MGIVIESQKTMAAHVAYYGIRVIGVVGYIVVKAWLDSDDKKDNP